MSFEAATELDAAAKYVMARPVNVNLIVSSGMDEKVIKIVDLLAAYPDLKSLVPEGPAAHPVEEDVGGDAWQKADDAKYRSIGGWLVVIGIGLVLSIGYAAFSLKETWETMHDPDFAAAIEYFEGLQELIYFELGTNVALIALALVSGYFYIGRKKLARPLLVLFYLTAFVTTIVDLAWAHSVFGTEIMEEVNGDMAQTVKKLVVQAILVVYLIVSERSRKTFVR